MKAIVAKVLFGGILGCLSWADFACANPISVPSENFQFSESPVVSANLVSSNKLPIVPQIIHLVDRIFTVKKANTPKFTIDQEAQIVFRDRFSLNLDEHQGVALSSKTYTHQEERADFVLGFQKPFWNGGDGRKYWGVTTVEHWGNNYSKKPKINLAKLNYTKLSSTLPSGHSTLTVSGGGNENLAKQNSNSREFKKFRGGVSYHHGVVDDVTMGVGFVYEDFLVGFTQLTYNSDRFPLKTTISLLANESGVDFLSHVRLKPAENLVLNYYHDREKDKFDASWQILSGLTLTADANTKTADFNAGIKVAVKNEYMSISAKAALDRDNNLQWKLKSNIGGFKLVHSSNKKKHTSAIDLSLRESNASGFQCSAFVKYESEANKDKEAFTVWGGKLQSGEKITPTQHLWSFNLGYGSSSYGNGLIASGAVALKPNLFLKLSYQEISATSDDTKIKLQISSNSIQNGISENQSEL
ncbi:MAG: hypothetical protein AAGE96_26445 [Cyanobacteria bacterium P01_G01_bin.19]